MSRRRVSDLLIEPPPGFRGLSLSLPVEVYTRHLPHWRQAGATYFVTFHLADSLPRDKLDELRALRAGGLQTSAPGQTPEWEALQRAAFERAERWLDQGHGTCLLRCSSARKTVSGALEFADGNAYEMGAYAVMPNHVHGLVRPLPGHSLEAILKGRKSWTAREVNRLMKRSGALWSQESYDRIVRDTDHLWRCLQYIGANPRRARLSADEFTLWVRPEWKALGWGFTQADEAAADPGNIC